MRISGIIGVAAMCAAIICLFSAASFAGGLGGQPIIGPLSGAQKREVILRVAAQEIGVRELTGRNDGPRVEMYLQEVGRKRGDAWCGAFVSWCLNRAGVRNPNNGWSPSYFPAARLVYRSGQHLHYMQPQGGDLFGIYYAGMKRIAHVGLIESWGDKMAITIEGNTNDNGSREGIGVFRKRRPVRQVYAVSNWVDNL